MFVFGDGDCGQLGLGEEVTERTRPFPVSVEGKQVSSPGGGGGGCLLYDCLYIPSLVHSMQLRT